MFKGYLRKKTTFGKTVKSQTPYILVISSIVVSHFAFESQNLPTLLSFLFLIPTFVHFQFDGRIPVGFAIWMLVLAAISASYGKTTLANQLAVYAYWLLVVGAACLTMESIRENGKSTSTESVPSTRNQPDTLGSGSHVNEQSKSSKPHSRKRALQK